MNANIRFYLNQTYQPKVDMNMIKKRISSKKSVKQYLNEKPTIIFLGVTFMGSYFKISTGEMIKPIHWDSETKRIKLNYAGGYELNILLDNLESAVRKHIYQARLAKPNVGFGEIKSLVKNVVSNSLPSPESNDFFEVLENFIEKRKGLVKTLTTKKYKTFRNIMLDFQKHYKKPISFDDVTLKFEESLKNYLINERELLNNSIDKYFDNLKAFMRWAFDMKHHNNVDFHRFKAGRDKIDPIYLSVEELFAIEDLNLTHSPLLDQVRLIFLVGCYTGQRYSDICNMKYEDIIELEDGFYWKVNQIKSNKGGSILIPLLDEVVDIIDKFKPKDYEVNWKALPTYSGHKMNRHIKEVCRLAGITDEIKIIKFSGKHPKEINEPKYKLIGTHTARRSFVTLGLHFGMEPEAVMGMTGHENYKTMKPYIGKDIEFVKRSFLRARNNMKKKIRDKKNEKQRKK